MTTPRRHSSRIATQRLANGFLYTSCDVDQTSLILALSHRSGWSADHIALRLMDTPIMQDKGRIQAEYLWTFFSNWISSRQSNTITPEENRLMNDILAESGIYFTEPGKPLSMTDRPTTVIYNTMTWTPDVRDHLILEVSKLEENMLTDPEKTGIPLMPTFSMAMRAKSKEWMKQQSERVFLASPSPRELAIFEQFGDGMAVIFGLVLKSWAKAVRRRLRNNHDKVPDLRPIKNKKEFVAMIMRFADKYIALYEDKFGKIETTKQQGLVEDKPISLTVQSTAFAGKIFLCLIMADRLETLEILRKEKRDALGGLVYFDIQDLSADSEACDICYDDWSPDEDREKPIQLVICCFKVLGEGCIKKTISMGQLHKGKKNVSCPNCRYEFPDWFIEKFKEVEEVEEHDEPDQEEIPVPAEDEVQIVDVVEARISEADTTEIFVDALELVEGEVPAVAEVQVDLMEGVQEVSVPGEPLETALAVDEASPNPVLEEIRVPEPEVLVIAVVVADPQADTMDDVQIIGTEEIVIEGDTHHSIMDIDGIQTTGPGEVVVNLRMLPDEFVTTSGEMRIDV